MTQQPSDWVLVGGEVLIGDDRVRRDLVVTGSTLAAVVPPGQAPADLPQVDAAGRLVTPGMIDTHIHGAAGVSFGAGDPTPALSWRDRSCQWPSAEPKIPSIWSARRSPAGRSGCLGPRSRW